MKLIVALTNHCTSNCGFCYRRESRAPSYLAFEDYTRILDELEPKQLRFAGVGEPLLHPKFEMFVRYAVEYAVDTYPHVELQLTSNGQLLTRYMDLMQYFTSLWFSLNAATQDTYKRMMPGSPVVLGVVVGNIVNILGARGNGRFPKVRASFIATRNNFHELPAFARLARDMGVDRITVQALDRALNRDIYNAQAPRVDDLKPILGGLHSVEIPPMWAFWPGPSPRFSQNPDGLRAIRCGNAEGTFGIFHTSGEVVHCCYMAATDFNIGNIYEQSPWEIWEGERHMELLDALHRGDPPRVCRECNNYWSKQWVDPY